MNLLAVAHPALPVGIQDVALDDPRLDGGVASHIGDHHVHHVVRGLAHVFEDNRPTRRAATLVAPELATAQVGAVVLVILELQGNLPQNRGDVGKSILILLELSLGLMLETSVSKYSSETAPRANANNIIPEIMFFDMRGLLSFLDLNTVFFLVMFFFLDLFLLA